MKKIILPLVVILVFGISIYSVVDYNKNKSKDSDIAIKENSKTNSTGANTSTSTVKDSASANPSSTMKSTDADKIAALNFKLTDLNGKEVSLSDFKGKKVFLNFWASWCPPCKAEMPDIEKLYGQTKDSDLVILAVNIGDAKTTAKSFIDNNKYNFTVLLDSDQSIATKYNIVAIPTSFFINKEGNIVSTIKGGMTLEQMKINISKL
ncbi:redoxin domain-containing protein [Clostridium estertheticum]|uniref:redoxin domain-containing protein n=1 Tax=Clostridium estertheticum TaxID=238834 RepID=UPI0013E8F9BA|nr:redoxin domain-containing protein [Clostridium estertheticum]MBN4049359.1 redoxin domain-containing protein [bacterium AH-315-N14]MBZ9686565.1 redoxin domain-containing protein [Clostridium estertheticum]